MKDNKKSNLRICTLTHHTVPNYGAVLQAFALQKAIKNLGYKSEILNYISERVQISYYLKFPKKGSIKKKISYFFKHSNFMKRKAVFDAFLNQYILLSKETYTKETLKESNQRYDLFITGSDQVWNLKLHQMDTAYMLDFVIDNRKKGSYAASFGYETIPNEYKEKTKELLNQFQYINVREESGKNIINELNISKPINVVLDPTLLLEVNDWKKFVIRRPSQKYVLVYDLINSEDIKNKASKLAEEYNYELINIHPDNFEISVQEFISLFYNASFVITSSFHGMAFSIIFNKEFYFCLNKNKINNNSRLIDLANSLGLEKRNLDYLIDFHTIQSINYKKVNQLLASLRDHSLSVLKNMINNREGGQL